MRDQPFRARVLTATITCALAAAAVLTTAGTASGQDMRFGVRGGANIATVQNDADGGSQEFGSRTGVAAGVFFAVPLGWVRLQPEVLYTSKGAALDLRGIESTLVLDYLEVPVLVRWPVAPRVYVAAGPAVAWRLKARSRTKFSGATEEVDVADSVKRYDAGVTGAVGIEFGRLVVDGRYTHGLLDIDTDTSDDVSVRNRAITITAGIAF
jgi:hypothetical protein